MKKTVYKEEFVRGFRKSSYRNNFSEAGLEALYDYLTELEEDIGEEIEFDIVAIASDFSEYESIEEYNGDYGTNYKSLQEIPDAINIDGESFIVRRS